MRANPKILVVDDDPDLRRSLLDVLEDEGYDVACAENGEEALRLLGGALPSAILLDLTMPVMDGWTFRARQRSDPRLAAIPTVVVTASYSDAAKVADLSPAAFLAKPFEAARLAETLRSVCSDATPPASRDAADGPRERPGAARAPRDRRPAHRSTRSR